MVQLCVALCSRHIPGPHRFWGRRAVFHHTARFYGRRRNCYRIAVIAMQKALHRSTLGRQLKYGNFCLLWQQRLEAACQEHDTTFDNLWRGLMCARVELNRRVLADLALWEPRSFAAIVDVSRAALVANASHYPPPARCSEDF